MIDFTISKRAPETSEQSFKNVSNYMPADYTVRTFCFENMFKNRMLRILLLNLVSAIL